MLRHVIAPAHAFAQIPNAILRHPRLSPEAKTLLNWQLSLPSDEKQCLSATADKAGIKKIAFQKAKSQLREEGYLHEWTTRGARGRFLTVQLVSNTPLNAKEALAVRDGLLPAPGGARLTTAADAQPSAAQRAARQRTRRSVGHLPEKNTWENTTQPTVPATEPAAVPATEPGAGPAAGPAAEPVTEPAAGPPTAPPEKDGPCPVDEPDPDTPPRSPTHGTAPGPEAAPSTLAAAETLLLSLAKLDPQLAMPARTARNWAPLAAKWLERGLSRLHVRNALTDGLADARKPLGALRWRLEHTLPEMPPPPPPSPATPKPEPRITGMHECRTRHTQPRLFRPEPGSDQELCPDCRTENHNPAAEAPHPSQGPGYAAFLEARRNQRLRPTT